MKVKGLKWKTMKVRRSVFFIIIIIFLLPLWCDNNSYFGGNPLRADAEQNHLKKRRIDRNLQALLRFGFQLQVLIVWERKVWRPHNLEWICAINPLRNNDKCAYFINNTNFGEKKS